MYFMLLPHDKIIGLSVETQSGRRLGKIQGLIIEVEGQNIRQYLVKAAGVANIFAKDLLVGREQVISLTAEKMIVDDNAGTVGQKSALPAAN